LVERNPANHPSETEAWVARLDADLGLTWWTFMGSENLDSGSALALDVGSAVALDGSGNLYALGQSTLPWPVTLWGAPSIEHPPGGSWDFYVARFDAGAGAGACPPEDACVGAACLAKRAQDWGAYVSCVEAGLAEHYLGKPYRAHLNGCRDTYFEQWKPRLGSRFEDNGDSVTDKLTALVWEKKTGTVDVDRPYSESDVHDVNNEFTWSTSSATGPWLETGTAFRTLLAELNEGAGFDGSNGWRVPTIAELQTLMKESGDGVLAEFPDVTSTGGYWSATSSPYVEGNCTSPGQCAWNVIFENDPGVQPLGAGSVPIDGKEGGRHVRAVRGGW